MTNGLYGRCIHDLNPIECSWCKENQKLRELVEKELKDLQEQKELTGYDIMQRDFLIALLEESKK